MGWDDIESKAFYTHFNNLIASQFTRMLLVSMQQLRDSGNSAAPPTSLPAFRRLG